MLWWGRYRGAMASSKLYRALLTGLLLVAGSLLSASPARARPQRERLWLYGNLTAELSEHWSLTLMPGVRFEVGHSEGAALGHYMDEVFVGPNYRRRFGRLSFGLSLWYSVMGPDDSSEVLQHGHYLFVTLAYRWRLFR